MMIFIAWGEKWDKYPCIDVQTLSVHENDWYDIPSETKAAERSELSVSVIPVEENKEEEKTLALSSASAELVVDSMEV